MKKTMTTAALVLAAGQAMGQWSDDFNRATLGGSWLANGGTFGNFSISGNQGAHAANSVDAMLHASASGPYQLSTQTIDLHMNPGDLQYVALGSGYGAGNNLHIKIQSSAGSTFDSLGFYSGLNVPGGWAGASPSFPSLTSPFTDGRMQVYFTEGGDRVNVVVDTNFDGIPDQAYSRTGVRAFMAGSGTGFGIGSWRQARFDNWRIMPAILPPSTNNGIFLAPFGANSSGTTHQVFRSGLWQTPVRITGVRYASQTAGPWTGNVSVNLGYTSRVAGAAAPSGLDIPVAGGGGSPNAAGPMFPYFSNAAFSQTLVAGVAPLAEDFQLAINGSPGFVYFPGMGNLLMETNFTVGSTTDVPVTRGVSGSDSMLAFNTSRFASGTTLGVNSTPLVQFVALPVTPEVLPTWPDVAANALPFGAGTALTHQVHHAATLAPLGVGPEGSGKVAIQGLKFAPHAVAAVLDGQVRVRMGYTSRAPGVPAPAGLEIPTAGGGGAPNASGPMRPFMDRTMNVGFTGLSPENFQLDLHQTPFVFDPAQGNLLIEFDNVLTQSVYVSRAGATPEAGRAYRSSLGDAADFTRATRIKFAATPVLEKVYPAHAADSGLNVPFSAGVHVVHQVFSAAQFGSEPVRIDSIAYAAQKVGVLAANVTVRLGYTSRAPNQVGPVGLSVPNAGGGGEPNAAFGPMASFYSGPLSVNVGSVGPSTYQIVMKGGAPFLYNPALGNLLVEVVSNVTSAMPVIAWTTATSSSSISLNSTAYGQSIYPSYAPLVKFTYFKDLYPCIADMTGDNVVDLDDFFGFLQCWDLTAPCADVDGTPGVDLNDFFAFLGSWDEGC